MQFRSKEKSRLVGGVHHRFDVVIVGARCAGAPLALLLARRGLRVCVLDRSRFPSDTPSTHGIQPAGVRVLDDLGVGARLRRIAPPIDDAVVALGRSRIEYRGITALLGSPMLNIRRKSLDAVLVEAAAEAGATVMTQTPVEDLVWAGGRVVGVRTPGGVLRTALVVGADGTNSTVAQLAGAEEYERTEPGRLFTWAYFEGVAGTSVADTGTLMLGKIGDNAFLASPTDDGLYITAVVPSLYRKAEFMADLERAHTSAVRTWPELEAVMSGARRVGPIRVMSRWHGYFRRSAGPGWVLVGDAGHFKDPTPGQGIADALRQVARLAPTIEEALDGADADQLLRRWWQWRDRDAWEMYWFAHDMGAPGMTRPLVAEVQAQIAASHGLTEDLIRVLDHDLPPSQIQKPSLVLPAFLAALKRERGRRFPILEEAAELVRADLRRRYRFVHRQRTSSKQGLPQPPRLGRENGCTPCCTCPIGRGRHYCTRSQPPVLLAQGLCGERRTRRSLSRSNRTRRSRGMRRSRWLTILAVVAAAMAGLVLGTGAVARAQPNPLPAFDWGINNVGQLGVGTTTGPQQCGSEPPTSPCSTTPVAVHLPASTPIANLAGGDGDGFAQSSEGAVFASGKNDLGQLGVGESTGPQVCGQAPNTVPCSTTPVSVHLPSGTRVTAISSSSDFSLALTSTGAVYAWGSNESGQLGIGTHSGPDTCDDDHPCSTTPVLVQFGLVPRIVAIAAGQNHGLAVTSSGNVLAWGDNDLGQLGDGTTTEHDTPVMSNLPFGAQATSVATAGGYSLARLTDGTVLAWGNNGDAQLGVGESTGPDTCGTPPVACSTTPVAVHLPAGTFVNAISGTFEGGQALTSGGSVLAWGNNSAGQLGIGTNTGPDTCSGGSCATSPVLVHLPAGVFALGLAGGADHVLAETASHNLLAWGDNAFGELGIGTSTGPETCKISASTFTFCSTTPVFVLGPGGGTDLANVVTMGAGSALSLAVTGTTPPTKPGAPLATSQQFGVPNQTDVFSVDNNGAVEVRWVQGSGSWHGPLAISRPGLALAGAHLARPRQFGIPNQTDVFVVGSNGATDVLWVQGAGSWNGPLAITPPASTPAGAGVVASNQFGVPDQTDVFVVGNDGATQVSWVQGAGTWQSPMAITPTSTAPPGAGLAASQQFGIPNQTDVFVVGEGGGTNVSWVQGAGTWRGPMVITPTLSSPRGADLAASQQFGISNQTDVFVVDTDGRTQVSWVQGEGSWTGPLAIAPSGSAPAGAGVAASNQFGIPNQTDVFVVGNDGATRVSWVQGAGKWAGPLSITPTGLSPAGANTAASNQFGISNQTDVFVVANDGVLRVSWVHGAGTWQGPLLI